MSRVATASVLALGLTLTPAAAFAGPSSKSADLSLATSSSPSAVKVGEVVTHTVTVANAGPNNAAGAVATYDVDPSMTLLSVVSSQGTCSGTSRISCSLGTVANGGTATVTVQLRPTAAGSFASSAGVSASTADPSSANNTATVTTTVSPLERIETRTSAPKVTRVFCPGGLMACGFISFHTNVVMEVAAVNGSPINEGTLSFTDPHGNGCAGFVYDGYAQCSYVSFVQLPGGRASYSGSSTYAPSSSG